MNRPITSGFEAHTRMQIHSTYSELANEGRATTIPVRIPSEEQIHDIVVGKNIVGLLGNYIRSLNLPRAALIVSSPNILDLHGDRVADALKRAGCEGVYFSLFPDGEENKSVESWTQILNDVHTFEAKVGRVFLVCLGGGVVMDVAAFAAACYGRGRDYIQLPTTLLGQVDCGIGGKCAINFREKNLVGVFYQPKLVLADLELLKTLPVHEIRSGLAEIIKYGVISEPELLDRVEADLDAILSCDLRVLEPIIVKCFRLKVDVVQQDERDAKGIRAKLNFGHTIGHAIEAATDYKMYSHGEAISIGMICACEIAEKLNMIGPEVTRRLETLLIRASLPTRMSADPNRVLQAMQHDKKFVKSMNLFILPTRLGEVVLRENIEAALIRNVVERRVNQ